jgi:N-acetyl-anhydromuramyl-L-alanine amidase AmpD
MSGRWTGLLGVALWACEPSDLPTGPPRCEPEEALDICRELKDGYRALYRAERDEGRARFEAALRLSPDHPEARLILSELGQKGSAGSPAAEVCRRGRFVLATAEICVDATVNPERHRFEEVEAQDAARVRLGLGKQEPARSYYEARKLPDGTLVAPKDARAVEQAVDLVVIHDTHTLTARDGFLTLVHKGASSHFMIDHDGVIYQLLDLGYAAAHTRVPEIDPRSIAIDLVNPVSLEAAPLPEGAAGERRSSDEILIQGTPYQHWGYTEAQTRSLIVLVRALVKTFPRLTPQVPRLEDGSIPLEVLGAKLAGTRGIVGFLHISARSPEPGAGFDWESFARALE